MDKTFLEYQQSIDSLTVFSTLKRDPVIHGLRELFAALAKAPTFANHDIVRQYSDVLAALYPAGSDLSAYIRELVLADDNFYVLSAAAGRPLSGEIREAASRELQLLQGLAALPCRDVTDAVHYGGYLPAWTNSPIDLATEFTQKLARIPQTGYGIFAKYTFFRVAGASGLPGGAPFGGAPLSPPVPGAPPYLPAPGDSLITPVKHPDVQPLQQLFGYDREQALIVRNTEALLDGTGASNMLLYGDAGTGKSSTIKAVALEYADRGLRLVEIKKIGRAHV